MQEQAAARHLMHDSAMLCGKVMSADQNCQQQAAGSGRKEKGLGVWLGKGLRVWGKRSNEGEGGFVLKVLDANVIRKNVIKSYAAIRRGPVRGIANVQAEVVLGREHILQGGDRKKRGKFGQDHRVKETAQEQGFNCSTCRRHTANTFQP